MHTLSHCITTETQHPHCSHNLFKQAALQIIGLLSCDSYWSINSHFDSSNGVLTNMSSSWYHWYWLHLVRATFHQWKVHWAVNAEGLLSCVVDICNKLKCTQSCCPYEGFFCFVLFWVQTGWQNACFNDKEGLCHGHTIQSEHCVQKITERLHRDWIRQCGDFHSVRPAWHRSSKVFGHREASLAVTNAF